MSKNKTEVAVKTETSNLPALSAVDAREMYGEINQSDLVIPRLTVLEGLSPAVTKEKLGHPGDFFVTGFKKNLGSDPLEVVILKRLGRSNIRWKPLKDGGGKLCEAKDAKTGIGEPGGQCATCHYKDWTTDKDGKQVPPLCDENQNFIVVPRAMLQDPESAFPYAISGSKARLQEFKNLNMLLMGLMGRRLPLYAKSLIITPREKTSKTVANAVYHDFVFSFGNNNAILPEEEIRAAAAVAARFSNARVEEEHQETVD